jgi:uncharacterized protein YjbI with pentapeptide repeats
MTSFENPPQPSINKPEKLPKITKQEIGARLARGEKKLEKLDLCDVDLAGLDLKNISFRGSDIRGLNLYRESKEGQWNITNIQETNWTDATVASIGNGAFFVRVEAEKAVFGFTEKIEQRRKNFKTLGRTPFDSESGQYQNFNGNGGNFKNTQWTNIDFGGDAQGGLEASFYQADLSASVFIGCDLSYLDFSETKIENIKIIDPYLLQGLSINSKQIPIIIAAITLTDKKQMDEFRDEISSKSAQKALEDYFEIQIV